MSYQTSSDDVAEQQPRGGLGKRKIRSKRDLLSRYMALLHERPLITNAITSAVVCALGATFGSYSLKNGKKAARGRSARLRGSSIDWIEVISFAMYGGLIGGPMSYFW